jgi:hypothetical protein
LRPACVLNKILSPKSISQMAGTYVQSHRKRAGNEFCGLEQSGKEGCKLGGLQIPWEKRRRRSTGAGCKSVQVASAGATIEELSRPASQG